MVIVDASTLIALDNVHQLDVLQRLYGEITLTSAVQEEVGVNLPDWIIVNDQFNISTYHTLLSSLGRGEASSIALALASGSCTLVIDEKKGRRVAEGLGIKITGLLGIIIKAHNQGQLEDGKRTLEALVTAGFRLSDQMIEHVKQQLKNR